MKFITSLLVALLLCNTNVVYAQTQFKIEKVSDGLGVPWGMTFLPDGSLLVSQREGFINKIDLKTGESTAISGLPAIKVEGQGGLFDIKTSPNYSKDQWLYISYNKDIDGEGTIVVAHAKLEGNALVDWQDIFISKARTSKQYHYGGRISFDDNGHFFLSIGDRGVRTNGQNTLTHAGSILRLNLDGSTPQDNPFVNNGKVLDEIWSYGHRNPQGLFFNAKTQQLWSIEHGPRGGDELNLIEPTKNYGWAEISHGKEYWGPFPVGNGTERDDIEKAIKTYIPSIAPSSLIQYSGKAFPAWQDDLFAGALKLQHLNQIKLTDSTQAAEEIRLLENKLGRIRNVIEDQNGYLFLATDNGTIYRLKPNIE
jgi:glucose/arabinose dehydrogenase